MKSLYEAPDWGSQKWTGDPRNQKWVARFEYGPYRVGLRFQDFRCPRFIHDRHFGEVHISVNAFLGGDRFTYASAWRNWEGLTPDNMREAELVFSNLAAAASKVVGKRAKEADVYLNRVAGLKRLP